MAFFKRKEKHMKKFCQNPFCESPSVKEVHVSVKKPSDQVRALCAPCEEAYVWGVQHGRKTAESKGLWILAVADRGIIAHVRAYSTKTDAEKGLVKYLRKYHSYDGQDNVQSAYQWLRDHDEYLSVCSGHTHEGICRLERIKYPAVAICGSDDG